MRNKLLFTTALVALISASNVHAENIKVKTGEQQEISGTVSQKEAVSGGAYFNNGELRIADGAEFTNNFANVAGGAIYNNGTLNIGNNVIFDANKSFLKGYSYSGASEMGGAIYSEGNAPAKRKITIGDNVAFKNNEAYAGSAIYLFGANEAVIGKNAVFENNKALKAEDSEGLGGGGGAISIVGNGGVTDVKNGNIKLIIGEKAVFRGNEALYGGAINNNTPGAEVILENGALFEKNNASSVGGSIANLDKFTATNITFRENTAQAGGAVYNWHRDNSKGNLSLTDATFIDNTAKDAGGAVYNTKESTVNLFGTSVFSGNRAKGELNDIHNDGTLNISGNLELDGGITGSGIVNFEEGSSLKAALAEEATKSTITAGTIKGTTAMVIENGSTGGQIKFEGNQDEFKFADNALFNVSKENGIYTFAKKSTSEVAAATGANANQANAVAAITSGETSNATFNAIASNINGMLQSLNKAEVQAGLDAVTAMSPEVAPLVQQNSIETTNQVFGAVGIRLSGGSVNAGNQGMSSGDNPFEKIAVWVQGLFNKSKLDDTSKAKGFDADTYGTAFGVEKQLDRAVKAGVGYAYSQTDIEGFMRDTDVDTHTAIVYGEYKPSNWYVNGIATYGWSDYSEDKNVAGVGVKADYDVETFGLQAMTGYDMNINGLGVTPEVGLRYVHISQDAYKDSADQSVSANDSDILTGVIGAKVSKNFELENGTIVKPEARVAATYDLFNDDVNSVVTLANGSAYSVNGEALDRFGMEFGAGVTAEVNDKVELSLGYEGKFREDYEDHTGLINAKYKF